MNKNDKNEDEENKQIIKEHSNYIKEINLYKLIEEKNKEIDLLKLKLSNFPFNLKNEEKLISIIIISKDESNKYSIICKNTEKFRNIEDKFYERYPEYLETKNYFECNGHEINVYKSLKDNKIYDNDILTLFTK